MPRNSSGVYTLPSAAFVANTTVSSAAVNLDFSDIATAITGSMATTGVSTMTGPLFAASGSLAAPSITYGLYLATGWYISSVATSEISHAANGVQVMKLAAAGMTLPGVNITDKNSNLVFAMPFGTVSPFAWSTAPTNWLLCYGQAISRTTYAGLYAAISTTYGVGDGSTTFNVPDLRGRVPYGKDNMGGSAAARITTAGSSVDGTTLGAVGGIQSTTVAQANLPLYTLSLTDPTHTHTYLIPGSLSSSFGGSGGTQSLANTSGSTTSGANDGVTFTSGGSSANLPVIDPALITAYIIYAGV